MRVFPQRGPPRHSHRDGARDAEPRCIIDPAMRNAILPALSRRRLRLRVAKAHHLPAGLRGAVVIVGLSAEARLARCLALPGTDWRRHRDRGGGRLRPRPCQWCTRTDLARPCRRSRPRVATGRDHRPGRRADPRPVICRRRQPGPRTGRTHAAGHPRRRGHRGGCSHQATAVARNRRLRDRSGNWRRGPHRHERRPALRGTAGHLRSGRVRSPARGPHRAERPRRDRSAARARIGYWRILGKSPRSSRWPAMRPRRGVRSPHALPPLPPAHRPRA